MKCGDEEMGKGRLSFWRIVAVEMFKRMRELYIVSLG
jgi:hypothetical protein